MPSTDRYVEKAASVLRVDGSLIALSPSITQIMTIVETIRQEYLPLKLDRVLKLGPSMTGGREWDIRSVKPRTMSRSSSGPRGNSTSPCDTGSTADMPEEASAIDFTTPEKGDRGKVEPLETERGGRWHMVCRPKVGERIIGGGFVGVWERIKR